MLNLYLSEPEELVKVTHALASEIRVSILQLLNVRNMNIIELADALQIPVSTAASNVKVLEKAGLIVTELQPATRGAMKVCSRNFNDIRIKLSTSPAKLENDMYQSEMPIGHFVDYEVSPTCGMASSLDHIIPGDDPSSFFSPQRVAAQLLWFRKGFIEYRFPLQLPSNADVLSIEFSLELCSEAAGYDNNWPSDITVWVNQTEVGAWTSPGDFGGRRGQLNPAWWPDASTQYGLLKTWKTDKTKSFVDDVAVSNVVLNDLRLQKQNYVSFKIGVKDDAVHKGGLNLFGKQFGDYAQDIVMKIYYSVQK
ncbi:ArsR/SmtB family transcription factor [Paenibacillus thalictri]|uniref:ArsR family transcriptional regulator n=1 Tax=Paenibacillus thalictri TaxID=2527873 RepID=A0A4Q9DLT7_9BACL|nr:ArsR family transcriptional regulator [Paenibacillus thalictri]TBL73905.1 ArsR family transcriptional regulator [Paenibacillus thalictri]